MHELQTILYSSFYPKILAVAHEKSESKPQSNKPAIVTTPITTNDVEVVSDRVGQTTLLISVLESIIILKADAPCSVDEMINRAIMTKKIIPISLYNKGS